MIPNSPPNPPPSFAQRLIAFLVDAPLCLAMAIFPVMCVILPPIGSFFRYEGEGVYLPGLILTILVIGWIIITIPLYAALFHSSSWQATPGKRVVGLQVTDLQDNRLTFKHAFLRQLYYMRGVSLLSIVRNAYQTVQVRRTSS